MRTPLTATLLLAATLLPGASNVLHAQDACTAASFKGAFGCTLKGFVYDDRYNITSVRLSLRGQLTTPVLS